MLAAIRPDNANFPLLVHVLGATVLVGGLMTAFAAQLFGWRREEPGASAFTRLSFWALLLAAARRIPESMAYVRSRTGSASATSRRSPAGSSC